MHPARHAFLCLVAPASLCGSPLVAGCGGPVHAGADGGSEAGASSGSSSSGSDSCSDPSSECVEPPSPPQGVSGALRSHDYAIHDLFLGDTDRMGVTSADAWRTFGYDLDEKRTTASSTDVCTPIAGATRQVQVDGAGAIDNSWGENMMPIIVANNSGEPPPVVPQPVSTEMMYVRGFDDSTGNTTHNAGLTGVLLAGVALSSDTLTWNLSMVWPVAPGTVSGCTAAGGCPAGTDPVRSALVKWPSAFQVNGTFSSGTPVDVMLPLNIDGQTLPIDIRSAIVTFSPDGPGAVTNGTIAGVLSTQELIATLHQIAGNISTSLCTGSAFQNIAAQIEQTSDIVYDGKAISNPPGQLCNAISIGLGFNAIEIAAPSVIAPGMPQPPDRCGD